jgi:transcriptional regulator with XRE-family HTH domain
MKRKYPLPSKEEAEEIKRLRQEAGISIPKIAEALHVNKSTISEYENGKRGANPELIERLRKRYRLIIQSNT